MTTAKTKNIVKAHFDALFSGDARVSVAELKRGKTPALPVRESDIDGKAYVYLQYPPTMEAPRGMSGNAVPWTETGAVLVNVAVASQSADAAALADEIAKTVRDSLRSQTIGDDMDITGFAGTELGEAWLGNFIGETFAVEFETQDVG